MSTDKQTVATKLQNGQKLDPVDANQLPWWIGSQKFFSDIFTLRVFTYYFWTSVLFFCGAILIVVTFKFGHPRIDTIIVCPAKHPSYFVASIWMLIASFGFTTSVGHAYVEALPEKDFQSLNIFQKTMGFLVRTLPLYLRLLFFLSYSFLFIISFQVLLLPECNSLIFVGVIAFASVVHLFFILFGIHCKNKILVPAYLYEPMTSGTSFLESTQRMMRAIGP